MTIVFWIVKNALRQKVEYAVKQTTKPPSSLLKSQMPVTRYVVRLMPKKNSVHLKLVQDKETMPIQHNLNHHFRAACHHMSQIQTNQNTKMC